MQKTVFEGHSIDPQSYTNDDMPGYWFPYAIVTKPGGEEKIVSLPPARGLTKERADADAVDVAKKRIAYDNL